MQAKLGNGVIAAGRATKDADMRYVGNNSTPLATFSLAVGTKETPVYIDCKAWSSLAKMAMDIHKGDCLCVIGTIEERESNGKMYKSLVCEWFNNASYAPTLAIEKAQQFTPTPDAGFTEVDDSGDLPF
jgi:single-stranded DNA-binding protein